MEDRPSRRPDPERPENQPDPKADDSWMEFTDRDAAAILSEGSFPESKKLERIADDLGVCPHGGLPSLCVWAASIGDYIRRRLQDMACHDQLPLVISLYMATLSRHVAR